MIFFMIKNYLNKEQRTKNKRPVKSKVKISQNLAAFSEYMNFNYNHPHNISGPAEYTPLALLVIVRDGGKSEKLRVQKK